MTVSLRPLEEQCRAVAETGATIPAPVGMALVDTGANRTHEEQALALRAGLTVTGREKASFSSRSAHTVRAFARCGDVVALG